MSRLLILLLITTVASIESETPPDQKANSVKTDGKEESDVLKIENIAPEPPPNQKAQDPVSDSNSIKTYSKEGSAVSKIEKNATVNTSNNATVNTTSNNATFPEESPGNPIKINPSIPNSYKPDTGALYRLSLVLLGLCIITVLYVSFRFYRTRKGGTRSTTVRKYGVLTQRTDIEMLPLPLDDDEDDDTVFDVGNHMNR